MPENKHISLLFFKIYMKNTTNMLDDIGNKFNLSKIVYIMI